MPRHGNPGNLRVAARRKHEEALERAEQAVNALVRGGEAVNFRAVARLAGCSPDFLYRTPALRTRIEQLRKAPRPRPPAELHAASTSVAVVRALTVQLADEKRRRREEVTALEAALAAAHGELLELRRRPSASTSTGAAR